MSGASPRDAVLPQKPLDSARRTSVIRSSEGLLPAPSPVPACLPVILPCDSRRVHAPRSRLDGSAAGYAESISGDLARTLCRIPVRTPAGRCTASAERPQADGVRAIRRSRRHTQVSSGQKYPGGEAEGRGGSAPFLTALPSPARHRFCERMRRPRTSPQDADIRHPPATSGSANNRNRPAEVALRLQSDGSVTENRVPCPTRLSIRNRPR